MSESMATLIFMLTRIIGLQVKLQPLGLARKIAMNLIAYGLVIMPSFAIDNPGEWFMDSWSAAETTVEKTISASRRAVNSGRDFTRTIERIVATAEGDFKKVFEGYNEDGQAGRSGRIQ